MALDFHGSHVWSSGWHKMHTESSVMWLHARLVFLGLDAVWSVGNWFNWDDHHLCTLMECHGASTSTDSQSGSLHYADWRLVSIQVPRRLLPSTTMLLWMLALPAVFGNLLWICCCLALRMEDGGRMVGLFRVSSLTTVLLQLVNTKDTPVMTATKIWTQRFESGVHCFRLFVVLYCIVGCFFVS